nr:MAG TPA: hypothetical protein [Caudoviricetes sp.]
MQKSIKNFQKIRRKSGRRLVLVLSLCWWSVPGVLSVFLPIIRKQHKQDNRPTQKRLKFYLFPIDI